MTQLKVAYDHDYDTVVLGAFGCGAFCNPLELVADPKNLWLFVNQVIFV